MEGLELKLGASPEVWQEVDPAMPGFDVRVRYLEPSRNNDLIKAATRKLNRADRLAGRDGELDHEKYAKLLVEEVIRDWRGFKLEFILDLMPLAAESVEKIRAEYGGEVPFSLGVLESLGKHTRYADLFERIIELAKSLELIRKAERAILEKNSAGSPAL